MTEGETEEELGAHENEQRDPPVEEEEERDEGTIYMEGGVISYGKTEQSDINKNDIFGQGKRAG